MRPSPVPIDAPGSGVVRIGSAAAVASCGPCSGCFLACRRQVELLDVLLEHPRWSRTARCVVAIERRIVASQRLRQAVLVAVVPAGTISLLEQPVEVLRVGPVLGALVGVLSRARRWPSRCRPCSPRPTSRRGRSS